MEGLVLEPDPIPTLPYLARPQVNLELVETESAEGLSADRQLLLLR
jgi:hypothetical protein